MRSSIVYHRPIWFRFLGINFRTPRKQGVCVRCMLHFPAKSPAIISLNIGKGGDCNHLLRPITYSDRMGCTDWA